MNTTNYTTKDLQDFYTTKKFPKNTQFQVMFTERMNGKPLIIFSKGDSFEEADKLLLDYINEIYQSVSYWRVIFLEADAIVIDFGSHVYFGLIKIIYPNN